MQLIEKTDQKHIIVAHRANVAGVFTEAAKWRVCVALQRRLSSEQAGHAAAADNSSHPVSQQGVRPVCLAVTRITAYLLSLFAKFYTWISIQVLLLEKREAPKSAVVPTLKKTHFTSVDDSREAERRLFTFFFCRKLHVSPVNRLAKSVRVRRLIC